MDRKNTRTLSDWLVAEPPDFRKELVLPENSMFTVLGSLGLACFRLRRHTFIQNGSSLIARMPVSHSEVYRYAKSQGSAIMYPDNGSSRCLSLDAKTSSFLTLETTVLS